MNKFEVGLFKPISLNSYCHVGALQFHFIDDDDDLHRVLFAVVYFSIHATVSGECKRELLIAFQ